MNQALKPKTIALCHNEKTITEPHFVQDFVLLGFKTKARF